MEKREALGGGNYRSQGALAQRSLMFKTKACRQLVLAEVYSCGLVMLSGHKTSGYQGGL